MRLAVLLALTVFLTVGAAQEPVTGAIFVDPGLEVNEGETLVLGPGAVLTGPGRVEIRGTLDARGTPGAPVQLAVPVILLGNGSATLRHVRAWGVDEAALTVQGGTLTLEHVVVEGNGVGVHVARGVLVATNLTLREHADAALRLGPGAEATVRAASFASNARHVDANGSRLALLDARLDAPTAPGPALLARDADARTRNVTFDGGDVAVRLEGPHARLASTDDEFLRVRVALQLAEGEANLTRPRFATLERDVDAGPDARLQFTDARFTPAIVAAPHPPGGFTVPAWWVLGGALVLGTGGVAFARLRPRPAPPAPPPEPPAPPAPPDLSAPLTDIERRILRDVAAHPGTAQAAVAQRLGMTRQALHYHVKKLEARRLLRKEAHGRETRCTIAPGVEALLA